MRLREGGRVEKCEEGRCAIGSLRIRFRKRVLGMGGYVEVVHIEMLLGELGLIG